MFRRLALLMLRPIQLNDQLRSKTNKIDDIRPNRRLPPQLMPIDLLSAQQSPQTFLRARHLTAQSSSKLALFIVSIHGDRISPLPSPPRKGEGAGAKQKKNDLVS
jgi:hypothetical protein